MIKYSSIVLLFFAQISLQAQHQLTCYVGEEIQKVEFSDLHMTLNGLPKKVMKTYEKHATPRSYATFSRISCLQAGKTEIYYALEEKYASCHAPAFQKVNLYTQEGKWLYSVQPFYCFGKDTSFRYAIENKLTEIEKGYRKRLDNNYVAMSAITHHSGKTFYMIDFRMIPFKKEYLPTNFDRKSKEYDLRLLFNENFEVIQKIVRVGNATALYDLDLIPPILQE
jgi:hypothetical protein